MQCRRRWSAIAVVMFIGAGTSLVQARDPVADAKAMDTAKGSDAVSLRAAILDDISKMDVTKRDTYVGKQMLGNDRTPGPFIALLSSSNPDAQLNAAITIAQTRTLAADATLESMLKHANPAIRYWGAKGLTEIMPDLIKIPAAKTRAITALTTALVPETSGVVKQQIIRALGAADDVGAVSIAADSLAAQMQSGNSDHETIDAAATALNLLDAVIKKGATIDKSKVAKSAAWIASFSAQQIVALKARLQEGGGTGDVPEAYQMSVVGAITSSITVLNDLVGKNTFPAVSRTASPEEIQFAVDGIAGSTSSPGSLQTALPDVKSPPAIKK